MKNVSHMLTIRMGTGLVVWLHSLVADSLLSDCEVMNSNTAVGGVKLSPWKRLFTHIFSPHSGVK